MFLQGVCLGADDLDLSVRLLKLLADVINIHKTTGQGESLAQAKKVNTTYGQLTVITYDSHDQVLNHSRACDF